MKKIVLMAFVLVLGHTLIASGIKNGSSVDPPSYKHYSKGMNLGVQVGDKQPFKHYSESTLVGVQVGDPAAYEAQLPLVYKDLAPPSPLDEEAFQYGVMTGFLLSTLVGDFTDNLNLTFNLFLGAYAYIVLTSAFILMPQLYYAALGTAQEGSSSNAKLRMRYLMLPIMLLYVISPQFRVGFGPYLAFLLGARDKGDGYNEDVKDIFKGFDAGIKLALFYQAATHLTFSLAFSNGLVNVQESDNFKRRNQFIMFSVFYNLSHLFPTTR